MIVKIYPQNPDARRIEQVVEILRNDGVIIYPTDSVYAYGCSLSSSKAIERIKTIRGKEADRLTVACADLSQISAYARMDNDEFQILRRNFPGPFTFILNASSKMPAKALEKRKTVGIRIPGHSVSQQIIKQLGCPMITASVKNAEEEYTTDPELIEERYGRMVDAVIDGGYGQQIPTALVDLSGDEVVVLREGKVEVIL
ncbi:threonylcarbamoyl-AMP synthase [Bacteroidia bacterium]|nr:threonylcarbamoyl-AMP synthase [Bacteroidia bacterium]